MHVERDSQETERWRMNSPERQILGNVLAVKTAEILNRQNVFHGFRGNFVDVIKQSGIKKTIWLHCPFLLKKFY